MSINSLNRLSRRHVVKGIASGVGCSLVPSPLLATAPDPEGDGLSRASPQAAEVDPRAVLDFIDSTFANDLDLHSFMLYCKGHVVAEGWSWPYASHRPHMMHSLTKSVTATGVGLAIDEGYFSLDDSVLDFFPDEQPPRLTANLKAMTVKDLLTMQSGHTESVSGSVFRQIKTSWIDEFFKIPVTDQPGTHFLYSSAVSFLLSAIVTRTTKETLRQYLESRLFKPLGITSLTWGSSPNGINSGGNGLTWKTVDSLKLGILHLNGGNWHGKQLISRRWVEEATRTHVSDAQYGYHWWQENAVNAFYAEGAFGQFSIVFPRHDAVLALTAGVQDGEALLNLVWDQFPGAFKGSSSDYRARAEDALARRIENLRLLPEARATASPTAQEISGRTFVIEPNQDHVSQVSFNFSDGRMTFHQSDHRGDHTVHVGIGNWIESTTGITGNKLHHQYQSENMKVVASGHWWDENTFEMTWQFVESAWVDRLICRFYGDQLSIDRTTNANYASRVQPTLRGKAEKG